MADETPKPTAADVLDRLRGKWPDAEYCNIREAPQDSMRQGRKIDLLVISLWNSRGHERDAVEVKVSGSDWKRELDKPEKADWWYEHCHRFWIAVPGEDERLVARVKSELPETWGLLAAGPSGTRVVVKAPRHTPEEFTRAQYVGIVRAAANAGANALMYAEQRGYDRGHETARRNHEISVGADRIQRTHAELVAKVRAFEEATGINVTTAWDRDLVRTMQLGQMVKGYQFDPVNIEARLVRMAEGLTGAVATIEELRGELKRAADESAVLGPAQEVDDQDDQQDDDEGSDSDVHAPTLPLGP